MEKPTYLQSCAKKLFDLYPNGWEGITIIVPGRRAARILHRELALLKGEPQAAPRTITMGDWVTEITGKKSAPKHELLLELYIAYKEIFQADAFPFDRFMSWGSTILSDFNTIDHYLLDEEAVFRNLKEYRELEEWSFLNEELSESQIQYNHFWQRLGKLNTAFKTRLKETERYSTGMLARMANEQVSSNQYHVQQVYALGLNVLTRAEQSMLKQLHAREQLTIWWDADALYVKDPVNEAGLFIRSQAFEDWKAQEWEKNFAEHRNISIHACATQAGQAELAAELLEARGVEDTAIVLADEGLLIPLLHILPEPESGANVTMGYPLARSGAVLLLKHVMERPPSDDRGIYFKHFFSIWDHPYFSTLADNVDENWRQAVREEISRNNRSYLTQAQVEEALEQHDCKDWSFLFFPPEDTLVWLEKLDAFLEECYTQFARRNSAIEQEEIFQFSAHLAAVSIWLDGYPFLKKSDAFYALLKQQLSQASIDFFGEPLQGLQILGMLETRALDFDRVILLSANETILPKSNTAQSFIPHDLKLHYKLPTQREADALFAYYFYRLIQRSSSVDVLYSTTLGGFAGAEPTRYIAQLEEYARQYPQWKFERIDASNYAAGSADALQFIPKTEWVKGRIKEILQEGMSASALNTFVRCPLDFYYKYVVGLSEQDQLEEQVETNTFGTIVHDSLEELYTPFVGKVLHEEDVENMKPKVDEEVKKQMLSVFSEESLRFGLNYIGLQVAQRFVHRFLAWEIEQLKVLAQEDKLLTIVGLEEKFNEEVDLGQPHLPPMRVKGLIDRIDSVDGQLRIIDYKTGDVKPAKLKLKGIPEDLATNTDRSKALQLLLYAYAWRKKHELETSVVAGNISLRKLSQGICPVLLHKAGDLGEVAMAFFEEGMAEIVTRMLGDDVELAHDPASEFCEWCA